MFDFDPGVADGTNPALAGNPIVVLVCPLANVIARAHIDKGCRREGGLDDACATRLCVL